MKTDHTNCHILSIHAADDVVNTDLNQDESQRLSKLENIVKSGIGFFINAGNALAAICNERLYRQTHATFSDYCRDRWALDKSYVHRIIRAAVLHRSLVPIGTIHPTAESQIRPLTKLPLKDAKAAWQQAVAAAGNQQPTANQVKLAVAELKGIAAPLTTKKPLPSGSVKKFVAKASDLITLIHNDLQKGLMQEAMNSLTELEKLLKTLK
jgi:hypothetical protein